MNFSDFIKRSGGRFSPGQTAVLRGLCEQTNALGYLLLCPDMVAHVAALATISIKHAKKVIGQLEAENILLPQLASIPNGMMLYRLTLEVSEDE